MAMPTYEIRDIPDPLWKQLTARSTEDGYPLHALVLQLLEDYADGHIRPRGEAPLQKYVFLKSPYRRLLANDLEFHAYSVKRKWQELRELVEMEDGRDSQSMRVMDSVEPTHRSGILAWLERLLVKRVGG